MPPFARNHHKKLCEIIDVRDGTHESPKYVLSGYPLVTSKNIKDEKIDFKNINYITEEDFNKINQRSKVDLGDILMPMIGTIGNPVVVNTKVEFAIKNVALFKFRNNEISNRYVYYALKSPLIDAQIKGVRRGGTQEFISLSNIRNLTIPLPPLEIQKRIAAVLDKAKELIDKRKEQIEKLNEFVQRVFFDIFGNLVKNDMGWKEQEIREVSQVKIGPFGSLLHAEDYIQGGIPLINPSHIVQGKICPAVGLTISKEKAEDLSQYRMATGSVVVGRRGEIGRCAVVTAKHDGLLCGTGSLFISPSSKLNPIFLVHAISSAPVRAVLGNAAQGITMKNLNSTIVESLEMGIPPIDIQYKFAQIVEKTEQQKELMQQSLTEMENNFNSIMQKAFQGELF